MNRIEALCRKYESHVSLPWTPNLAGHERVWFAIYDPMHERRLRARVEEFALATRRADHDWVLVDVTDSFGEWMASQEYRESYFESPDDLGMAFADFQEAVCARIADAFRTAKRPENTVVAVLGVGSLFGFLSVSKVVDAAQAGIAGRLLVFFPGEYEDNNYRLLDARDGWDYLAVPIIAASGGAYE